MRGVTLRRMYCQSSPAQSDNRIIDIAAAAAAAV